MSSEALINGTIKHFSKFQKKEISKAEAKEIIANFTGFARLLLKLDEKRKQGGKKFE